MVEKKSNKIKNEIELDPEETHGIPLDEASKPLTPMQRRKRAMVMRRYRAKIKMARKRMMKRKASPEKIKARAKRQAINAMKTKLAGGKSYKEMSPSEKMMIDKRVAQRKSAIERIARRLIPKVRQQDLEKFRNKADKLNEDTIINTVNSVLIRGGMNPAVVVKNDKNDDRLEGTPKNTQRYLKATPGQPNVDQLFEQRFK